MIIDFSLKIVYQKISGMNYPLKVILLVINFEIIS